MSIEAIKARLAAARGVAASAPKETQVAQVAPVESSEPAAPAPTVESEAKPLSALERLARIKSQRQADAKAATAVPSPAAPESLSGFDFALPVKAKPQMTVAEVGAIRLDDIDNSKFNHPTQPKAFNAPENVHAALEALHNSFNGQQIVPGVSVEYIGSTLIYLMSEARKGDSTLMAILEAKPEDFGILVRAANAITGRRVEAMTTAKTVRKASKAKNESLKSDIDAFGEAFGDAFGG